ncbi:MAG TPA: hypothetical protein VE291_09705 [Terracidiphilus sp.]|jgi:hypothetical protein|nr:hypothetical protein [Terracidiphilus sp.]
MDKIARTLFFEDPRCYRQPPGDFGVLYLLRRDINSCFDENILWPGALAILAGIDLLGKFFAGDDRTGQVHTRFRNFIVKYTSIAPKEEKVIYHLRNSMLHSFGLYSKERNGNVYRFQLVYGHGGPLVEQREEGLFRIDLAGLREAFESSIMMYYCDLLADQDLQSRFMAMFPFYGAIPISA